jgi:hypothetical protein
MSLKMKLQQVSAVLVLSLLSASFVMAEPSFAMPFFHNNNRNAGYYPQQPYFGYSGDSLDARENRLGMAIQRAIAAGKLSPREADKLLYQQTKLNHLEQRLRADDAGFLTPLQRVRLNTDIAKLTAKLRAETAANRLFI